tara:strand:- start:650 stop:802 length:153 start_codon:yes stop_codon:yes gene_type:complete
MAKKNKEARVNVDDIAKCSSNKSAAYFLLTLIPLVTRCFSNFILAWLTNS